MNTRLRKHQLVMFEMLQVVDEICKKHHISYMLFAGTLLGAVRHQGFIPWDDDLDIVMLRSEYERFMEAAPLELNTEMYYLQKEFSKHWPLFFSKLRKNNTACMERYIAKDSQMHQGVYIDIFPCDNLSDVSCVRKLQFAASKIVIAKALDKRGYLTDSKVKKAFIAGCRLLPKKPFIALAQWRGNIGTKQVHTFFGASSKYEKNIYPREWFERTVSLTFEGESFPVSKEYGALLTKLYGDYMTPLPEEKRGSKVHGEIVDLEHSFERYLQKQKEMKIREYTRCIR